MATATTTGLAILAPAESTPAVPVRANRRRRISPQAGHALGILGRALEHLTDEFVHSGASFSSRNPQLEAVQLLMARNLQVYFECPEIPSLGSAGERCSIGVRRSPDLFKVFDGMKWGRCDSSALLPEGQHGKQQQPGQAHGVPVPGSHVHGNLAVFDALEPTQSTQADDQSQHTEN
jgi:hypothetical protein